MPPRVLHGLLLPGLFAATLAVPSDENLNLSRLAGSGREIEACAAAWRTARAPVLLRGMAANIRGIQNGLERSPGVLHFATHVVHSSGESRSGFIVLSLKDNGQHEILGPAEISTWHVDGTVVALSGCSSGLAAVLPGTGLMGLTRAWLTAGARAIVASLWPSPDDTGTIFLSFYRHLKTDRGSTAAVGLRNAQLEMLRSHSWRSNPIYWASYFITGNQQ